jgi:hypothetical protein
MVQMLSYHLSHMPRMGVLHGFPAKEKENYSSESDLVNKVERRGGGVRRKEK